MNQTTIVNKYREPFDVFIGRPTIYGNPYRIGPDGDRAEVIRKYKDYFYHRLETDPAFKRAVLKLKGRTLGCYCKPQPCHGDVIVQYLNNLLTN